MLLTLEKNLSSCVLAKKAQYHHNHSCMLLHWLIQYFFLFFLKRHSSQQGKSSLGVIIDSYFFQYFFWRKTMFANSPLSLSASICTVRFHAFRCWAYYERNECELTFPALTRRARHSAIDSVNKSRPANSFSNRTPKEISILAAIRDTRGDRKVAYLNFTDGIWRLWARELFHLVVRHMVFQFLTSQKISREPINYTRIPSNVADFSVTPYTENCTTRMKLRGGSTASRNGFLPFRRQHGVTIIAYFCEEREDAPRGRARANLTWARAIRKLSASFGLSGLEDKKFRGIE